MYNIKKGLIFITVPKSELHIIRFWEEKKKIKCKTCLEIETVAPGTSIHLNSNIFDTELEENLST